MILRLQKKTVHANFLNFYLVVFFGRYYFPRFSMWPWTTTDHVTIVGHMFKIKLDNYKCDILLSSISIA